MLQRRIVSSSIVVTTILLQGCAGIAQPSNAAPPPIVRVMALVADAPPQPTPSTPGSRPLDAKTGASVGVILGGATGATAAVVGCAPFLWGPPLYGLCALSGAMLGSLGGGVAGGVIGDASARSRSPRDAAPIAEALLSDTSLVDEMRADVVGRLRAAMQVEVVDQGTVQASQRGLFDLGFRSTEIALRVTSLRSERADEGFFRLVATVQADVRGLDGSGTARTREYVARSEPLQPETFHNTAVTVARRTFVEVFAAAEKGLEEQLTSAGYARRP